MNKKRYPTKKVKNGGKEKIWAGDMIVYQQDGTVITVKEVFAGYVTGKSEGKPKEIEFYTPE